MGWRWGLFFVVWAMAFWGGRPIWDPDPARYAEAAREMLTGGHWLVPQLNGYDHLTKPPFTYWITALGMKLFGVNAWGARFFLSMAFGGTILCIVELARVWGWERRRALMAGLIFATALLPFACSTVLSTDMFLTFWETLGVLAAWKVWRAESRADCWRVVFWTAFGVAFLTKGPPAWLPLLVIAAFHLICPRRQRLRGLGLRWGVPLMLAIALSWFLALEFARPGILRHMIGYEVRDRVFSDVHGREQNPFFYFLIVPLGCGPWLVLWPAMLGALKKRLGGGWRYLRDEEVFSLLWVAIPLAVFTFAGSKMFLYVTPMMVPLALWMGWVSPGALKLLAGTAPRWRRIAVGVAVVWMSGLLLFRMLPLSLSGDRTQLKLAREVMQTGALDGYDLYTADENNPPFSFVFYTGRLIEEREEDYDAMPAFLFERELEGRPSAMMVRRKRLNETVEDLVPGVAYDVLASSHEYLFLRFDPMKIDQLLDPAKAALSPRQPKTAE